MSDDRARALADAIRDRFANKGRPLEAGFADLAERAITPDAPPEAIAMLRDVYMAGALWAVSCVLDGVDAGDVMRELQAFKARILSEAIARSLKP